MSRITQICDLASGMEEAKIKRIFENIDGKLKKCVTQQSRISVITYPKLARHMYYLALSVADEQRLRRPAEEEETVSDLPVDATKTNGEERKVAKSNTPRWTFLSSAMQDCAATINETLGKKFRKKGVVAPQFLPDAISDDLVSQFATFTTRRRGARTRGFYLTLALFLIHAYETGVLEKELFVLALPDAEKDLPEALFRYILGELQSGSITVSEQQEQEVAVRFNVRTSKTEEFARYFRHYAFGGDSCAHMLVYRPMRSKPDTLLKTFLAVSPPTRAKQDKNSFVYSHYYRPPKASDKDRFSSGKVLPLDDGVYMVGGQRPWTPKDETRPPFFSMKILAFRWSEINKFNPILPGLVMSTNYRGEPLISRIAARVTPISHSKDVTTRTVETENLLDDLKADFEFEEKELNKKTVNESNRDNFTTNYDSDALLEMRKTILEMTNNRPNRDIGVAVPRGFSRAVGKKEEKFSKAKLVTRVEQIFEQDGGVFSDDTGAEYEFWNTTRFGPLTVM